MQLGWSWSQPSPGHGPGQVIQVLAINSDLPVTCSRLVQYRIGGEQLQPPNRFGQIAIRIYTGLITLNQPLTWINLTETIQVLLL
ncbi:hypothetical protein MAR_010853 [Mya arenaria]|uniref:Uncharacterized protein n=1 Tax=Mya arenaria TaxID=6604 RepID=A0ABY7FVG0_MYAAR|nr:hypothetical protein MAR_010853 [Mya arenaria]